MFDTIRKAAECGEGNTKRCRDLDLVRIFPGSFSAWGREFYDLTREIRCGLPTLHEAAECTRSFSLSGKPKGTHIPGRSTANS